MIGSGAVENPFQRVHRKEGIGEPGSVEKMLEIVVALPVVATKAEGREERVWRLQYNSCL